MTEMDKILIVDDDVTVGEVIRTALEPLPYEITFTTDPEMGLQLAESLKPFIIILDMSMQPINGLEFISRLLQSENSDNTMKKTLQDNELDVLILTGVGSKELIKQCRNLGVMYFFNKPVHVNILRNAVSTIHMLRTKKRELDKMLLITNNMDN